MAQGPHDVIDPNKYYGNSLRFVENNMIAVLRSIYGLFEKGKFHYDDVDADCEIRIEGSRVADDRSVDTRPKITVTRGPSRIKASGINNFVGSANLSLFKQSYSSIRQGTIGISCYSRVDLEADQIAELTADMIESLRPIIRKFGYLQINTAEVGQRGVVRTSAQDKLFVTPVLVQYMLTKNYSIQVVDPVKLRKFILEYYIRPVGLEIITEAT